MVSTSSLGRLLGLSDECAAAPSSSVLLDTSLPTLLELTGAAAAVVVRREAGALVAAHHAGRELSLDDLDPAAPEPPAAWRDSGISATIRHELPGGGDLLLGWAGPSDGELPEPDVRRLALATLDAGLARLAAQRDLADQTVRVDQAQHLASMGDYDWHMPTDTNRWSDELYRIYGHEPQSFAPSYERFLSLIHPEDREHVTRTHQHSLATGEPFRMIERIVRPDGEIRYLSSSGEVVRDEDDQPVRFRGTCLDITERVLAEQEKERIDARFRGLVAAAPDAILVVDPSFAILEANPRAHDLLAGDPVGMPATELLPHGAHEGGLGVAGRALDGRNLTLDVSSIAMDPVEGQGLVALFLHDAAERVAGETMAARLGQAQLRRRQALEINDNVVQGIVAAAYALDAEQYPVAATYLERTMASARAMMDDLLDPLDGEDLRPGDLVRATAAGVLGPGEQVAAVAPAQRRGGRALIVDDAEDLRLLLRTRLERIEGLTIVGEACDGIGAIEKARELQPDLVLLDLAMPRMDGLEALPHIRSEVPDVRIIVFSGFNQNTLAEKAMSAGADRYVVKGGPTKELIALVESVLEPT